MKRVGQPTFRTYDPERDEAALIDLLTTEPWPHRMRPVISEAEARADLDQGDYASDRALTVLAEVDGALMGVIRAENLGNEREDPQLDFRVRERARGRGIGLAALRYVTDAVFARFPDTLRIEGQTRQDNVAMRKVFVRGGYVQEAVYRQAWPSADGRRYDGIGYGMLRSDWESGTTTPLDWD